MTSATPLGSAKAQLFLAVPFDQKDRAKAIGARWEPALKKWYVPHGVDIAGFAEWWPEELQGQSSEDVAALLASQAPAKAIKPVEAAAPAPVIDRGPPPPIDPNDPPPWL